MRIAVDAMGGDHGPRVVVPGAVRALETLGPRARLILLGDEAAIRRALPSGFDAQVEVRHAPDEIGMHESPAAALRRKPDSSLARAIRAVHDGEADALLSAGSTGAVVAGSLLMLKRIGSVHRPAIATSFPSDRGHCIVLDSGANANCRPQHLLQFGMMGSVYAEIHLGLERPRVGLLNIGEEESKGNDLAMAAYPLLRDSSLNFVGNVEGRDILAGGADVVVCDGFVGNIVLKFGESMLRFMGRHLRGEIARSWRMKLGAALLKPAFDSFRARVDYQEEGGAPLLGVNGIVIITHGKSPARAIENATISAGNLVVSRMNQQIRERLGDSKADVDEGAMEQERT
jgi:glycerol-3-phosphate acyltransferase PlsX